MISNVKKIAIAIAIALMLSVAGTAEPLDVGGSVGNTAPVVNSMDISATMYDGDGNIPIDSSEGAKLSIAASVVDNNGFTSIVTATYNIVGPAGTSVGSGNMALIAAPATEDVHGISGIANADVTLPATSVAGTYTVTVTITDDAGASASDSGSAVLTSNSRFSVTPLMLESLVAGNTVQASFTVTMNYGDAGERVQVNSVTISDLSVLQDNEAVSVIPASALTITYPEGNYGIGEAMEVMVQIDVPLGTRSGTLSGTGNLVLASV